MWYLGVNGIKEYIVSPEELLVLADEWRYALGLQNWTIKIVFLKAQEMPTEGAQATVEVALPIRGAVISFVEPDNYVGNFPYNMEQALIHELLHIKFESFMHKFKPKSTKGILYEQEVDAMATILYNLKRMALKDETKESKSIKRIKNTT